MGCSEPLLRALHDVAQVAPTDSTVLITGETGTGKELVARAIHRLSRLADRSFLAINGAAIPHTLIGSELYGRERVAPTGAANCPSGCFEAAKGGTIFLDEIGDIPSDAQAALLRLLQDRESELVSAGQKTAASVRMIAATHRDLNEAVDAGTFRADLFYRLNVFPIRVPSLRERPDDIPLLVKYFVERHAAAAGKIITEIARKSVELLQEYHWPGNVRELQNVIERAVILCNRRTLSIDESWLWTQTPGGIVPMIPPLLDRKACEFRNGTLPEKRMGAKVASIRPAF